jgi:hypothetical protein
MKLSSLTIYIIGVFFALPILMFGYFMNWVPNMDEKQKNEDVLAQIQAEIAKSKQADDRKKEAIALVKQSAATWQDVVATRTPLQGVEKGGIDLAVDAFQLSVDTRKFRNSIQRALNHQLKAGGVTVVNGPYIPDIDVNTPANQILANYYNYPAIAFPVVIFDLGTVTVQGTYKQIFTNMRSWANMPRYLAVADGLAINGTSPNLTGTYNLTLVGFVRGKTIAPAVREGAATASNTGGLGAPTGGAPNFGPSGRPGVGGPPPGFGPRGPGGNIPQ